MDYEENMAAEQATEAATADDMLTDEIVEEVEEPAETLDSLMGEEEETKPAEETQPEQKGTAEPGYVQKRIDKALARQRESMKAEIMAEMEAQYAPIRDRLLEMDAKELVRQGEFKSVERAKEYLQLKQGIAPAEEKPAEQPRQKNGQYAPKADSAQSERITALANQADSIKAMTGIDVMAEFESNPDIKKKVISGEMDFIEVAKQMQSPSAKRKPPAPTRSSNGASGQSPNAIESMSKEQFARMEKKIAEGARYTLR